MSSLNSCMFIGNVGRKPETRYSPNGEAICNFSIAVNETWKDKATGEKREATEWVRVVAFGKLGEICGQYLDTGKQVFVQGQMKTRKWTDKDGVEKYTTEIRAQSMQLLGGRPDSGEREAEKPAQRPQQRQQSSAPGFDDMDDDIPFSDPYRGRLSLIV